MGKSWLFWGKLATPEQQVEAIASVGISTATLAATTFTNSAQGIVDEIWPVQPNQPTPAFNLWASSGLAFFLSLVIGLMGAWITSKTLKTKKNPK